MTRKFLICDGEAVREASPDELLRGAAALIAQRFRRGMRARFGTDEVAAWRYCEQQLTPLRLRIRQLARALLVHPRYLPYEVAAAVAGSVSAVSA